MPRPELLQWTRNTMSSITTETKQNCLQWRICLLPGGKESTSSLLSQLKLPVKECTGSICLAYGLESCQCMEGPGDSPTKACELCCKEPGEDKPCLSSFELNSRPHDVPDMYSKPGTPCNDYQGYCDVFQKCREVTVFFILIMKLSEFNWGALRYAHQ